MNIAAISMVSGGEGNTAGALRSSVSGGGNNAALGSFTSIIGGTGNTLADLGLTVTGYLTVDVLKIKGN